MSINYRTERSRDRVRTQKYHPREWVDVFKSGLQKMRSEFLNPTHGSGWTVQIQPIALRVNMKRLDLNYPPTPVGGISAGSVTALVGWI